MTEWGKYSVLDPGLQLVDPKPLARQLKALTAGTGQKNAKIFPPLEFVKLELAQIKSKRSPVVLLNQEFAQNSRQQGQLVRYVLWYTLPLTAVGSQAGNAFI